jgi:hypothetical protein
MAAPLLVCNASVVGTANSLETGQFWDEEKTRPMSYDAAFGSNGQRDLMRSVAKGALEACSAPQTREVALPE